MTSSWTIGFCQFPLHHFFSLRFSQISHCRFSIASFPVTGTLTNPQFTLIIYSPLPFVFNRISISTTAKFLSKSVLHFISFKKPFLLCTDLNTHTTRLFHQRRVTSHPQLWHLRRILHCFRLHSETFRICVVKCH